jgi:hypothetical protein
MEDSMAHAHKLENIKQVPQRLIAVTSDIKDIKPEIQSISYKAQTWKHHLENDIDLLALVERFPQEISRADLAKLSREAYQNVHLQRRCFIATMIWGYGVRGYGPWRTSRMLECPELSDIINHVFQSVKDNDLLTAYEIMRIQWCGPAFLTKFLYVVGLGVDTTIKPHLQPLVLDSLVRISLWTLYEDGDISLSDITEFERSGQGWLRYVTLMNTWAKMLGCSPDALEMLLFKPSNFSNNFHHK